MCLIDIILFLSDPDSSIYCYYALYFLISFGTNKILKFQISHSFKEIIMIIKTYHIITIDSTQIIDGTLNLNLSFPILY